MVQRGLKFELAFDLQLKGLVIQPNVSSLCLYVQGVEELAQQLISSDRRAGPRSLPRTPPVQRACRRRRVSTSGIGHPQLAAARSRRVALVGPLGSSPP